MMEKLDGIVRYISEEIAKDLVTRRGKSVSDSTIAIEVADLFQDLGALDPDVLINKVRKGVDSADIWVSLPCDDEQVEGEL
jgi:hypothetical protein